MTGKDDPTNYMWMHSDFGFAEGCQHYGWPRAVKPNAVDQYLFYEWCWVTYIPNPLSSMLGYNFSQIQAASRDLPIIPAGFGVVAMNGGFVKISWGEGEGDGNTYRNDRSPLPYIEYALSPAPDDLFVWGLTGRTGKDICCVCSSGSVVILRLESGSWVHKSTLTVEKSAGDERLQSSLKVEGSGSLTTVPHHADTLHRMFFVPLDEQNIAVSLDGITYVVKISDNEKGTGSVPALDLPGTIWIGGAPGQQVQFHCESVGFDACGWPRSDATASGTSIPPILFNLGKEYKPTLAPELLPGVRFWHEGDEPPTYTNESATGSGQIVTSSYGHRLEIRVLDETGADWVSDGTHYKGGFYIDLQPAGWEDDQPCYHPTALTSLALSFPVKLTDRANSELLLDDTEFSGFTVTSSYRDPAGKRGTITLHDNDAKLIDHLMHRRGGYPVHIEEDTDNDGVPDTVRIRAWVETPRLTLLKTGGDGSGRERVVNGDFSDDSEWTTGAGWAIADGKATHTAGTAGSLSQNCLEAGIYFTVTYSVSGRTAGSVSLSGGESHEGNGTFTEKFLASSASLSFAASADFDGSIDHVSTAAVGGTRLYSLALRGLLSRVDNDWLYLPDLVNTDPDADGYIEPQFCVETALKQSGIDPEDAAAVFLYPDPLAGTAIAQLPGNLLAAKTPGQEQTEGWEPDWDKTKLAWARHIIEDWRGWLLYEDLAGKILYHPDLAIATILGTPYHNAATIYSTKQGAADAGKTGQYFLQRQDSQPVLPPANAIRITGQDAADGAGIHIIDRCPESIDDINDDRFLGETRPQALMTRLALGEKACRQIARLRLLRVCRYTEIVSDLQVPLAPWEMGLDSGFGALVETLGDYKITQCEATHMKRGVVWATFTLEKQDSRAERGETAGAYPGAAA